MGKTMRSSRSLGFRVGRSLCARRSQPPMEGAGRQDTGGALLGPWQDLPSSPGPRGGVVVVVVAQEW